ncbi:hypothetical protein C8R47DRAFT_1106563 [Mycena vitilis]|nr:hypothetical protein C8R47DRAFT_1106563 [Mycena vitilis]
MILDLSVELLGDVGSKLIQKDNGNLRAVCKTFGGAVEHLFFSSLALSPGKVRTDAGLEFLAALASGETGWSRYTQSLRIGPTGQEMDLQAYPSEVSYAQIHVLQDALGSMPNIRAVDWRTSHSYPAWERTTICKAINAFPALVELRLEISGIVDLSLPILSSVKTLKIQNRILRFHPLLGFQEREDPAEPPLVDEILRRLTPNLTTLELDGSIGWAKFWELLRGSQIRLTDINTSVVTPSLFTYLASYCGLQKLTLTPDGGNREASDRLADAFYEGALASHTSSLLSLSCPAVYESSWSFGSHNAGHIASLCNLKALKVSVNAGTLRSVRIEPPKEPQWITHPETGEKVRIPFIPGMRWEADQNVIDAVVADLLHLAATLPALRTLAILGAETERNRGAWCGTGRVDHRNKVNSAIEKAVQNFSSNVPSGADVHTDNWTFELKRLPMVNGKDSERDELYVYYRTQSV